MEGAVASLEGGFADPVFQSQAIFRELMDAMARPGRIRCVEPGVRPPAPLSPVAAAVACVLADADTPLWLDAALSEDEAVRSWLAFHTGAAITAIPSEAGFAIAGDPRRLPGLQGFSLGTQDYPDRSTTVILQVETLDGGDPIVLSGPGIPERATLAPAPMPHRFHDQWAANGDLYPRGVDIVLAGAGSLACLPRTTRIAAGKE